MSPRPPAYPTRARAETLFATANPTGDPEGLISRFLEFEFHRHRKERCFALHGTLTERLRALHWYLTEYGAHRPHPLPLSHKQIAFLNAPMPVVGLSAEVSVGAYSFITAEYGGAPNLHDPATLRECLYWWCAKRSLDFAPDGTLITPGQVRALTHVGRQDCGLKYPLNAFARLLHADDPALSGLNLDSAVDRAVLVCILMVRCARAPWLARFLPQASAAELLATGTGGRCDFDRLLAQALAEDVTDADAFRDRLEHCLSRAGASLRGPGGDREPADSALCLTPDPRFAPGLEDGVAVIGPFRTASGLGQAARLSVAVLDRAGFAPAVLEFGLDSPAPPGFATPVTAPRLRVPRQINLIHLNAEAAPLAFAHVDERVWDRSYNIGYVFWELDRVPKCQRLAIDMLDEIWVASEYNRAIYAEACAVPVHTLGMAVEPVPEPSPVTRAELGLPEDAFVFLASFDSFSYVERKNPLGAITTFQRAFPQGAPEPVTLLLKTQNRARVEDPHQLRVWSTIDDIVERDSRIRLVDRTLGYRDMLGLKRACDCYVSLHRSEGWGFGIIEAMQLRLPVIATGYSGNMEFCTDETSWRVDHALIAPLPDEYVFVERGSRWADPCLASAAAAMRRVLVEPDEARRRAENACRLVERDFSITGTAARYRARLDAIRAIIDGRADMAQTIPLAS